MLYPVEILLACYQGEAFLAEQLDSLFRQTYQNFKILARDDGSSDQTGAILESYAKHYPGKLDILKSDNRLGVMGNFNALLENASADYVFFSDQDDVWKEDKIEISLRAMHEAKTPILLHTDLQVVDENLKEIHPSFLNYLGMDPAIGKSLNRLLVQNMVTGCTVAINKPFRNLLRPFPKEALMHDWWMALVASACGKIISLPEKTVLYRQHSKNAIGAHRNRGLEALKKLISFITSLEANTKDADLRQLQAKALYKEYALSENALLNAFLEGPTLPLMDRKMSCLAHRFYRQGFKKIVPYILQNRPF